MPKLLFEKEVVVTPNPGGQTGFMEDWQHFFVALEGGWYSGKTFGGAGKLLTLHQYNAFDRMGNPTYVNSLIVAPTYGNAMDFCVPAMQDAIAAAGMNYEWHGSGGGRGRFAAPAIVLPELGTRAKPSVILVRSADIPKRITGFTVGAAWGDEPTRWKTDAFDPLNDAFIQMTSRVRDVRARLLQILLTYTNEGDATEVYDEMHKGGDDRRLYRAATKENPVAKDYEKRQRAILTPELAEQYLDGKAMSVRGGLVYGSYDFDTNVDADLTFRKGIPIQISLDFNIAPGMHLEVGQHHKDLDLLTCLYEIHAPRMDVQKAAEIFANLILNELQWDFKTEPPIEVFGDATGSSEWAGTGQSCYEILKTKLKMLGIPYRIRVPKAQPPVVDSVNDVNCALYDLSGNVHYKIHPRCIRLLTDFKKLKRDKYGEIDKEDRKLSHPSDAERYRIWFVRPIRVERPTVGGRINV